MKKSYLLALIPIVGIAIKAVVDVKKNFNPSACSPAINDITCELVEKQEQNKEKTE